MNRMLFALAAGSLLVALGCSGDEPTTANPAPSPTDTVNRAAD